LIVVGGKNLFDPTINQPSFHSFHGMWGAMSTAPIKLCHSGINDDAYVSVKLSTMITNNLVI
jgi:hypothetical protein